jgi:hypothetical protein
MSTEQQQSGLFLRPSPTDIFGGILTQLLEMLEMQKHQMSGIRPTSMPLSVALWFELP